METFPVHTSLAHTFTCFINLNIDEISCDSILLTLLFLSLIFTDAKTI